VTALVRVRNEAPKIGAVLRAILPLFDEIVVIDNGSDDDTAELVRTIRRDDDPAGKIRLESYPHRLARFGPEHDATPADSLRSAVYFSNWCLARCGRRFVCKWDGDMMPRREARAPFLELLRSLDHHRIGCWTVAGQTAYRDRHGAWYLALGEINREVELFPNGWGYRFVKLRHWERLDRPRLAPKRAFEPVAFYELKSVTEDEFGHWSTREWPSERKQREWANFTAVSEGRLDARFQRMPATFLEDQVA
jgi:glycosyltransferase involved in cell wall biosynthesis